MSQQDPIYQGGTADVDTKIHDRDGDLVDPAGLSYLISVDGASMAAATHGIGSVIEKVATGHYVAHLIASWPGRWTVAAVATGPQEIERFTFDVLR